MNNEQAIKIVELLESVRKRPAMYMGKVGVELTQTWLHGIDAALWMLEEISNLDLRIQVVQERGWEFNALGYTQPMVARGMSAKEIVDELLVIEIEVWQRFAQQQNRAK